MNKYISDVQTVEESGTTGIRITVSEDIGETVIRAVNTVEFENIESEIKKLQDKGITTDNLESYVKKLNLNAGTLEGHESSYFAKASDLSSYAKTSTLNDYEKIADSLWVGRIRSNTTSSDNWNYNDIEGMYNNNLHLSSADTIAHGLCLVIRPGGYSSDTSATLPVQILGFKDGALAHYAFSQKQAYIKSVSWKDTDGTSVTEECLVCPVNYGWSDCENGQITFNYRGKCITRLWQYI